MSTARAPIRTRAPTTQPGPMCAAGSICAEAETVAVAWMPGACWSGGKNSGSNRATATRAFGTRMRTFFATANSPETSIALAWLASAAAK